MALVPGGSIDADGLALVVGLALGCALAEGLGVVLAVGAALAEGFGLVLVDGFALGSGVPYSVPA